MQHLRLLNPKYMSTIYTLIRPGSSGSRVADLQKLLNSRGAKLNVDGQFGPLTREAVLSFQKKNGLVTDGIVGGQTMEALQGTPKAWPETTVDLGERSVQYVPLEKHQYIESFTRKRQIVLHHTAGGPDAEGSIRWWNSNREPVGTAFVIGGWGKKDGQVVQTFDDRYWAYHLGTDARTDAVGVAVEICNWGYLTQTQDGRFVNYVGGFVNEKQVIELERPWRGFRFWHAYSPAQLDATAELVRALAKRWDVPLPKSIDSKWFELNAAAQRGDAGLWHHANYLASKTDLNPQPELIRTLNELV